jgi:hypothetical protein
MNANKEDLGMLLDYELDLAYGTDENNFACKIQSGSHCCEAGYYLYMDGTEYGGIIDSVENDTETDEITYSGRTWHGVLNSKVLEPDSGAAYLTVSGEANSVIASLLSRMSLTALFQASSTHSGLMVSSYKIHRYITGYDGIIKMLDSVGGKLEFTFRNGMVVLSAVPKHDFTKDEEFDSDQVSFRVKKNFRSVNHLVCLGTGELENRMVVHLYVDQSGNISQTQTQFGMNEYSAVFDYSSVESEEELIKSGTDELKSLWGQDELSIALDDTSDAYGVGDIVGAYDNITKIAVSAAINKKIVTIRDGQITISYEVGE